MNKTILRKYAKLAVRVGINLEKGQGAIIRACVDQYEFVQYVVDECYKAGAKWVDINWVSLPITKLNIRHQTLTQLSTLPNWKEAKLQYEVDENPCYICILSEDPDGLNGINMEKYKKAQVKINAITKKYSDALENKQQWTIIAVPSVEWAKKVFPNDRKSVAVKKLWDAILETVHITKDNDPIIAWHEHNAKIKEKCKTLNDYRFESIEYKSPNGTDFKVGLIPTADWLGGGENTISGRFFNPNMPTEEVFTSPMRGKAEGKVVSTKPLSYSGQLIENFWVEFKEGKVVNCGAEKGKDVLEKMFTMDEGASYLGELALVADDSPISNSNILYFNTLFDENASCHLAVGKGFSNTLQGFEAMTLEETIEKGINDSAIHVDFMIGSKDLDIFGITKNGERIQIFKNGNWMI